MSDSDDHAPAPRKKPQPKPRSRRAPGKNRSDPMGSPISPGSTSSPPQARRRIEDDFFSKAKSYREIFKVQETTMLTETAAIKPIDVPELEEMSATDIIPILDFEDEAKELKEESEKEEVRETEPKRKREVSLTPPPELPTRHYRPINPAMIPIRPPPVGAVEIIDDDDDDEVPNTELDPELAMIAANLSSHPSSSPMSPSQSASGSSQSQSISQSLSSQPSSLSQSSGLASSQPTQIPTYATATTNTTTEQHMSYEVSTTISQEPAVPAPSKTIDILLRLVRHPQHVVPPELTQIMAAAEKGMKVTVKADNSFRQMMEWYCEYHRFHFQNLVFTFRGSRLIPSSTPLSLDFPARSVIDIYEINTYKYIKQQETLARSKKLAELDKYAKDAELLQAMQDKQEARARSQGQGQGQDQDGVGNNTKQGGHDEPVEVEDDEAEVEYLHIKLRGKDTTDEKIRVKKTTTVFAILSHYKRIKKISADTPVKLEFDDEAIDPSMAVGETEIEDDDMLDVRVG